MQSVFNPEFVTQTHDAFQGLLASFSGQACVNKSTDVGLPQHKLRTRGYQVQYFIMKNVVKKGKGFLDLTHNFRFCSKGLKGNLQDSYFICFIFIISVAVLCFRLLWVIGKINVAGFWQGSESCQQLLIQSLVSGFFYQEIIFYADVCASGKEAIHSTFIKQRELR